MVDPIALTAFAIISTLRGDVPLETWFPLIEDIFSNAVAMLSNILEVLV
jgi:hypothetical protein